MWTVCMTRQREGVKQSPVRIWEAGPGEVRFASLCEMGEGPPHRGKNLFPVSSSHGQDHELRFWFKELAWLSSWLVQELEHLSGEKGQPFTGDFCPSPPSSHVCPPIPFFSTPCLSSSLFSEAYLGLEGNELQNHLHGEEAGEEHVEDIHGFFEQAALAIVLHRVKKGVTMNMRQGYPASSSYLPSLLGGSHLNRSFLNQPSRRPPTTPGRSSLPCQR
jgi:hypothetical protein